MRIQRFFSRLTDPSYEWFDWQDPASHLTAKGERLEDEMGLFFREWLSKKSLLGKYAANSSSFRFYASVNQLRKESVISYSRPPMAVRMKLEGLTENADHLYRLEDLEQRFNKAISAYDEL